MGAAESLKHFQIVFSIKTHFKKSIYIPFKNYITQFHGNLSTPDRRSSGIKYTLNVAPVINFCKLNIFLTECFYPLFGSVESFVVEIISSDENDWVIFIAVTVIYV